MKNFPPGIVRQKFLTKIEFFERHFFGGFIHGGKFPLRNFSWGEQIFRGVNEFSMEGSRISRHYLKTIRN
jgi:hypothetical protein